MFIVSDNVYISAISSFNTYLDLEIYSETVSRNQAIHVTHLNSGEECYLVRIKNENQEISISDMTEIILKPANRFFFWPVDLVIKDSEYFLVFPCRFVPDIMSFENYCEEEDFLGLEQKHCKTLILNLLNAFESLYEHEFLFHSWGEQNIFINKKDFSVLIAFSDFISNGFHGKVLINKNEFPSECLDPYALSNDGYHDYYSEMYAMESLLFKILVGKYPYEGRLMDGIPKHQDAEVKNTRRNLSADSDFSYWLDLYLSHPVFVFDQENNINNIGRFTHEKIFLERWNSLTDKIRRMFCDVFSSNNIMRENESIVAYTPADWIRELEKLEFKLK